MKHQSIFIILFFVSCGIVSAQLPPTIHRIAPRDTAVDMVDSAVCSVPSLDEEHGQAYAPNGHCFKISGSPSLNSEPLRVEFLARIDNPQPFNILVAHEPKNSPHHWELFSFAGNGHLALYVPGNKPDHLIVPVNVADGVWRHFGVEFRNKNVQLFIDGQSVAIMAMNRKKVETPLHTVLAVGSLVEETLFCNGAIDDLKISGDADTLLLSCSFEPVEPSVNTISFSETMQKICNDNNIKINDTVFSVSGLLAQPMGGLVSVRSPLIDRLFPTAGVAIEPTVKPNEKPPKNVPKLIGDTDDLRKAISEHQLTTIEPQQFRAGIFATWGEQYIDLQHQVQGKTKLPRGAASQVYDQHALILPEETDPTAIVLRRTGALLEQLRKRHGNLWNNPDSKLARLQNDWNLLNKNYQSRNDKIANNKRTENQELSAVLRDSDKSDYFAACALRRQIMFADPELESIDRILFLARANYAGSRLTNNRNTDQMGGHFATQNYGFNTIHGGGLFTIADWREPTPKIKNLTEGRTVVAGAMSRLAGTKLDGGSFGYPELDYDGQTVYFSYNNSREHRWLWTLDTVWHLFKMQVDGSDIVQLTDGLYNDFDPCPLPDGRVVFVSERRGGFIRCFDENAWLRVTTYVLHSMKNDGNDIYPISFFETSEWQPSVDHNGMIVYTRWDYTDRENCLGSNFWTCFPDGRNPRAPHGNYPLPWHTLNHHPLNPSTALRKMDDFDTTKPLTELVDDLEFLIGKQHGDHRFGNCPDAPSALPMTEMQIRAIPNSHRYIFTAAPHHGETFGSLCILDLREKNDYHANQFRRITPYVPFPESESPPRGQYRYGSPFPLSEDVFLCNSWEDLVVLDRFGNEELICERELLPIGYDPRLRLTEPVPVRPRPKPPTIPRQTVQGEDFRNENQSATIGVVNVNIADMPLPADRPVKRLRVLQVIPKPNPWMNQPDIGYAPENTPRMPLGTVPVEDDGSVFFEAPSGKQLLFQILDEHGMAVQTMRAVAFVHPGEQLVCVGCHEPTQSTVPNRSLAQAKAFQRPPSKLEPEIGEIEPINFYRTVQPVFEKCVACHKQQQSVLQTMDFPDLKPYVFFYAGGMSGTMVRSGEAGGSRAIPNNVGAANSRLGRALFDRNHRDVISETDRRRIILWLDANAPRLGAFVNEESQKQGKLVLPVLDQTP
ncbi:MAG: hypothetical protein LBI18_12230 [Planctomycetaceae bacterium]|jgi:hypothetical protein|nr:hypothetical protein [Planctomycetaceae bacterium]